MTSLRRTVEGFMGEELYRKLGEEPNIELTWKLLRDLIGQQLFGSEYISVPYIESAVYFNQLFVFIKKRNMLSTLGLKPPTYKIVGNLDYLVNRDASTWIPQFDFSPWDVADGFNMYREYHLHVVSNTPGLEKSIELSVMGAHARRAQPPIPGSLAIHTNLVEDLNGVNTLYVITDVVFASYVKLNVRMGTQQRSLIYDRDVPIGFKYRKYKLHSNGTFVSEMLTTLQYTEREAIWLRPMPQPIPTVPRWDSMRRRYASGSGRRKARSNLTIPTPEKPRRSATWLQGGGVVRVEERPLANAAVRNARDVINVDNDEIFDENDWRHVVNQRRVRNPDIHNRRAMSLENVPIIHQP